jgi:hypothetical protein
MTTTMGYVIEAHNLEQRITTAEFILRQQNHTFLYNCCCDLLKNFHHPVFLVCHLSGINIRTARNS